MRGRAAEAVPVVRELPEVASVGSPLFFFRGEGFAAEMALGPSGDFVVRSGSKARVRTTTTIPRGTTALRNTLVEKGVLRQEGEFFSWSSPATTAFLPHRPQPPR